MKALFTVTILEIGARDFPTPVPPLIEVVFDRRFRNAPFGMLGGRFHPFAELARQDTDALPRSYALQRDRLRVLALTRQSLSRFTSWAGAEELYFKSRVCFWDSDGARQTKAAVGPDEDQACSSVSSADDIQCESSSECSVDVDEQSFDLRMPLVAAGGADSGDSTDCSDHSSDSDPQVSTSGSITPRVYLGHALSQASANSEQLLTGLFLL